MKNSPYFELINLEIPFWNYELLDLEKISDDDSYNNFCLFPIDIRSWHDALQIPATPVIEHYFC